MIGKGYLSLLFTVTTIVVLSNFFASAQTVPSATSNTSGIANATGTAMNATANATGTEIMTQPESVVSTSANTTANATNATGTTMTQPESVVSTSANATT